MDSKNLACQAVLDGFRGVSERIRDDEYDVQGGV